jgi:tRNA(fMet)-specific endonuclease VapC
MIVLDTDHVTILERGSGHEHQRLQARLRQVPASDRWTTIISYEEQSRGWLAYVARARSLVQQVDPYRKLNRHLDAYRAIQVLEFDERAATQLQRLRQARLGVGTMDLKIAAIVLAHKAMLITRNIVDFRKVSELNVEDWTI